MNVRFFAGTRAQYDSLPSPRNPLGLYFCEDTNELFWADRLLTDGVRIVPTYADLPHPSKAADGVLYYVTETRNGYVVPHGSLQWLQTIYAPATDAYIVPESEIYNTVTTVGAVRDIEEKIYGAINALDRRIANIEISGGNGSGGGSGSVSGSDVKAISFAGIELEEVDGVFTIDRRCAREALGFELPEGLEYKEIEILTKEYLEERLEKIPGTDFDLTQYYTKDEIDELIPTLIPDTSNFVTKAELPSIKGLASEQFVKEAIDAIEIPDTSGLVTKDELQEVLESIEHPIVDLTGYATETFVKNAIAEAELNNKDVDISGLATKDELAQVEAKIHTDYLKEIPSEYITETELSEAIANIEHPVVDLSDYATVDSVTSVADTLSQTQSQLDHVTSGVERLQRTSVNLEASVVKQKYEVLPIDGMFVQYRDGEIRLNTQRVVPTLHQVSETGNPNMYYATFRAFAPEGATQCKEGLNGKIDTEYSVLTTDAYGRKYTTIWAAIANTADGGATWAKWGDTSNLDKYLGFYYHFEWYNGDTLIGTDKVRVILTNDACHDDLVPDAVARRIDDKVSAVNTNVTELTTQVQNIEQNYVTNKILENYVTEDYITQQNYVTNQYIEQNYTTTEELENNYVTNTAVTEKVETAVTEVIQEKVEAGEISVKVDSISYGDFEDDLI